MIFNILSRAVLFLHFLFVMFVLSGFIITAAGYLLKLTAPRNMRFRVVHLFSVLFITLQSWIGRICPLTDLENLFRIKAGAAGYSVSFMEYWVEKIIYYDLPFSYFIAAYSVFLCLVVILMIVYPPVKKE